MATIRAVQADITTLEVDAIVNAANPQLQHGGGVAWAIARAGGPIVQAQSEAWVEEQGPLEPGTAAVTSAGEMPSHAVIHVAGPIYRRGQDNAALLGSAVTAALDAATAESHRSLAIPAISAGVYGYPPDDAARVIVAAVRAWSAVNPRALDEVLLVGYSKESTERFRSALE